MPTSAAYAARDEARRARFARRFDWPTRGAVTSGLFVWWHAAFAGGLDGAGIGLNS
jgi:hypothetical protein